MKMKARKRIRKNMNKKMEVTKLHLLGEELFRIEREFSSQQIIVEKMIKNDRVFQKSKNSLGKWSGNMSESAGESL